MAIGIKKIDSELQVVFGEVYPPNVPDADGEFMTPETIRVMAYRFLANGLTNRVDICHENEEVGVYVVESFIARDDDPIFIPKSWVVGVHIPDPDMWALVKEGKLNGFSVEALVVKEKASLTIALPDKIKGVTSMNNGHTHEFVVSLDEDGSLLGGYTLEAEGHKHSISGGSVTDFTLDHNHRYQYIEELICD